MMRWDVSRWTRPRLIEFALSLAGLSGALALNGWLGRGASRAGESAHPSPDLLAVRSLFIVLTPMRRPDGFLPIAGSPRFDAVGRHLTFRNDLFFSSHTALSFRSYLAYRDRWAKLVFLGFSILFAATVLLARHHCSIDVFSAYFITYALYRVERRRLRAPYRRLRARMLGRLLR